MFEPLPFNNLASPEELKRDFYRMEFKPLGDPQLEMYFLVPKSWKSQPITVKKKALLRDHITTIKLVMMTSAKMRARIEVHYARVGEDVALAEFAKAFIKENRLKLIRHQPGEFTGRVVFDALVKAPKSELARLTFSRHKDRIIILSCTTAEKAYPEFATVFGIATTSFKMVGDK